MAKVPIVATEHEFYVYKELGLFLARKKHWENAIFYLDKARRCVPKEAILLGLPPPHENDLKIKYWLAKSNQQLCRIKEALKEIREALELEPNSLALKKEECCLMYDSNFLEEAKVELLDYSRATYGSHMTYFLNKHNAVSKNLEDCLGPALSEFATSHGNVFKYVMQNKLQKSMVDDTPLYKKLKKLDKCDVLSIPDILAPDVSKCLKKHRTSLNLLFYQTYFPLGWQDLIVFKKFLKNRNYISPEWRDSKVKLQDANKKFANIFNSIRILHARCPFYFNKSIRYPDIKKFFRTKEEYLYNQQYKTRRVMFNCLRKANHLREQGQLELLRKYITTDLWNEVYCTTFRLLPWKLELIHEIYTILGLAFADKLVIVPNGNADKGIKRLFKYFGLRETSLQTKPKIEFTVRSTFTFGDAAEKKQGVQEFIMRLDKHASRSNYAIERAAIYHDIALLYLTKNKVNDSIIYARKTIEEAKTINNHLWQFLGHIAICKNYTVHRKVMLLKQSLEKTYKSAINLKSPNNCAFVSSCLEEVSFEIQRMEEKRKEQAFHKRKFSISSIDSEQRSF